MYKISTRTFLHDSNRDVPAVQKHESFPFKFSALFWDFVISLSILYQSSPPSSSCMSSSLLSISHSSLQSHLRLAKKGRGLVAIIVRKSVHNLHEEVAKLMFFCVFFLGTLSAIRFHTRLSQSGFRNQLISKKKKNLTTMDGITLARSVPALSWKWAELGTNVALSVESSTPAFFCVAYCSILRENPHPREFEPRRLGWNFYLHHHNTATASSTVVLACLRCRFAPKPSTRPPYSWNFLSNSELSEMAEIHGSHKKLFFQHSSLSESRQPCCFHFCFIPNWKLL